MPAGWERPGWFSTSVSDTGVRAYDWKGQYGNSKHHTYPYHDLINGERTFSWPGVYVAAVCKTWLAATA